MLLVVQRGVTGIAGVGRGISELVTLAPELHMLVR